MFFYVKCHMKNVPAKYFSLIFSKQCWGVYCAPLHFMQCFFYLGHLAVLTENFFSCSLRQHKAHQRNQGFSSSWSEKSSLSSSDLLKLRLRVDFYTGGCKLSIKSIVFLLVHHFQQFNL
ncbi:hypothetical protein ATANTOWER_028977 [Ataeniobius toweri]|uniref:Uncharacterized protein n=1 Tax=Ataeniobius toweri TaxID=208326 RepID=A0ABU7CEV8_9TELE|nr:hypothetical protein [Ataeniobius toweri]